MSHNSLFLSYSWIGIPSNILDPAIAGCISASIIVLATSIHNEILEKKKILTLIKSTLHYLESSVIDNDHTFSKPLCIECAKALPLLPNNSRPSTIIRKILNIYSLSKTRREDLVNQVAELKRETKKFSNSYFRAFLLYLRTKILFQ